MTCSARVYDGAGFGRMRECNNADKYSHEGKRYCATHYPPNAAKRKAKNLEAFRLDLEAKRRNRDVPRVIADAMANALNAASVCISPNEPETLSEVQQALKAYEIWSKS